MKNLWNNNRPHVERAIRLAKEAIDRLQLDLTGLTILTETGSGYFSLTPVIAALAKAKGIFAWTKDSIHGQGSNNIYGTRHLLNKLNLNGKVKFSLNKRPKEDIRESDIITNLGFVRPLDKKFLSEIKPGGVISYMAEKWELRNGDINVDYCRKRGIKLAGVWENHPKLRVFDSVGSLAVKLCHSAGFEVYQNNAVIWSGDNFGTTIKRIFKEFGAANVFMTNRESELRRILKKVIPDFIFIADYSSSKQIIGRNGIIDPGFLKNIAIIHLCGRVDYRFASNKGLSVFPEQNGKEQRMTRTLADLGMKPVIDLHTAGLKVGELLYWNKSSALIEKIV